MAKKKKSALQKFLKKKTVFRAEKLIATKPLPKGIISRIRRLQHKKN